MGTGVVDKWAWKRGDFLNGETTVDAFENSIPSQVKVEYVVGDTTYINTLEISEGLEVPKQRVSEINGITELSTDDKVYGYTKVEDLVGDDFKIVSEIVDNDGNHTITLGGTIYSASPDGFNEEDVPGHFVPLTFNKPSHVSLGNKISTTNNEGTWTDRTGENINWYGSTIIVDEDKKERTVGINWSGKQDKSSENYVEYKIDMTDVTFE